MLKRLKRHMREAADSRSKTCSFAPLEALEERRLLSAVTGATFFYNDSAFDDQAAAITVLDNNALATDKAALSELEQATFENYSSYSKGINGIAIDLEKLPARTTPTLADFEFRTGDGGDPSTWELAPAPTDFQIQRGAGENGSDRLFFTWDDASAVKNGWLQVTMQSTSRTRLFGNEVMYFGSAVGDTGDTPGSTRVGIADMLKVRANGTVGAEITNPYDINRDGRVSAPDMLIIRNNLNNAQTEVELLTAPVNQATDLGGRALSGSEVIINWRDQSQVESGYVVSAATAPDGEFTTLKELGANTTGTYIGGLDADTPYWFNVAPIVEGGESLTSGNTASSTGKTLSLSTGESLTSGSGWYTVELSNKSGTKGEAGYSKLGSLSFKDETGVLDLNANKVLIQAGSEAGAVYVALEGTVTITTNDTNEDNDYIFGGGAWFVDTVDNVRDWVENHGSGTFNAPGGLSGDDLMIGLEDTYEWTNVDEDYEDFYWKPVATPVEIDSLELSDAAHTENLVTVEDLETLYVEVNGNDQADLALSIGVTPNEIASKLLWSFIREDSSTPVASGNFGSGAEQSASLAITSTAARFQAHVGFDANENGQLDSSEYLHSLDAGLVKITEVSIQDNYNSIGQMSVQAGDAIKPLWVEGWHNGGSVSVSSDINIAEAADQVIVYVDSYDGVDQQMTLADAEANGIYMTGVIDNVAIGFDDNVNGVLDGGTAGESLTSSVSEEEGIFIVGLVFGPLAEGLAAYQSGIDANALYLLLQYDVGRTATYHYTGSLRDDYFNDNDIQAAMVKFDTEFLQHADQVAAGLTQQNSTANVSFTPTYSNPNAGEAVQLQDTIFSLGNGFFQSLYTANVEVTQFDNNGNPTHWNVTGNVYRFARDKFVDPTSTGIDWQPGFDLHVDRAGTFDVDRED